MPIISDVVGRNVGTMARFCLASKSPLSAHGSYLKVGNLPVNRDIFGHFINEA